MSKYLAESFYTCLFKITHKLEEVTNQSLKDLENRKDGNYKDIYDFAKRIDLRLANKKTFENLVLAGGFDSFKNKRAQYFNIDNDGLTFLEKTVKYGAKYQESVNSSQISLFGEGAINDTSDLTMDRKSVV